MFGAVSDRRRELKENASGWVGRRLVLEWVECKEPVSSVWLDNGLPAGARCKILFRLESPRSLDRVPTIDAGRELPGVALRLDIRLSSGLGLAGVAGGGRGSNADEELATLHGRSRRRSGDL